MQKIALGVITGLLVYASGSMADQAPVPPQQAAAVPNADNKMVCRTMPAQTGSRLGARRECRSQREWDDIQHQQQDETSKMQSRALTSGVRGQ